MEQIQNILQLIDTDLIVCGDKIAMDTLNKKYKTMMDVRSAAFYTFGQSKLANKNAVLIINGDYLPNVYTVLTEAWFQKTNFIVLALYNSIYDIETHYLDRCTISNIAFMEEDFNQFEDKIRKSLQLIGPKLFNIVIKAEEKKINYNKILEELQKHIQQEDTISIYDSENIELSSKVNNIEKKYKYGIISKYLASTINLEKGKKILICPKECVEIDLNIFNNREMNPHFKMIVTGNIDTFRKWIEANNIEIIDSKNIAQDIENLYKTDRATILNIKEEDDYVF